jgi:hypothetical protein
VKPKTFERLPQLLGRSPCSTKQTTPNVQVRIRGTVDLTFFAPSHPDGQDIAVKAYARLILLALTLGCMSMIMTGCGGSSATGSTSNPPASGGSGTGGGTGSGPGPSSGGAGSANTSACSAMATGAGANLNGVIPFPSDSLWNKDISGSPVDPASTAIINFIGTGVAVHPDFGAGLYAGSYMGIPYTVVGSGQSRVSINFNAFGNESDPGPMPIPANANIEGYPNPSGDQHVLVLDNSSCWLYELYGASTGSGGSWNAGSAAVWDLLDNQQRPLTWTSADAAGLPIFPGLVRYDEVASGQIKHALRFTLQRSKAAFIPPASHWAANSSDPSAAPMGMRMRLKSSFNVSGFSAQNQVILNALKKYGMIMADNGSSMYLSGAPDDRWDNDDLHQLGLLKASDFEVVAMGTLYTAGNLPNGSAPVVTSFTATPTGTAAGQSVTLNWNVSGASYLIISPEIGAVRGTSVTVKPSATTTYTLYATNAYGRTQATITVAVQ